MSLFVLLTKCMKKLKFNNFIKIESEKSPHFPLRGMIGQLSKRRERFVNVPTVFYLFI